VPWQQNAYGCGVSSCMSMVHKKNMREKWCISFYEIAYNKLRINITCL
jgi:hypothetical protein